jgi:SEC-C motif domain protein
MNCFCGNQQPFKHCCGLIINGTNIAETPELLMRSRYSAYATNNAEYIYQTYSSKSRKEQSIQEIKSWAEQTQWLKLTIKHSDNVNKIDANTDNSKPLPTVGFCALYIHNKSFFQMSETSRFTLEKINGVMSMVMSLNISKFHFPSEMNLVFA